MQTSSQRVWENPDGSYTAQLYPGANWTQTASGDWAEIDTRLIRDLTGQITPRQAAADITLSNGGFATANAPAALATVEVPASLTDELAASNANTADAPVPANDEAGTKTAALVVGSKVSLPQPVIEGNQAIYRDFRPGQDLRVKVVPGGVETFVDFKSRPSAVPSQGIDVSFPLSAKNLSVNSDGAGGLLITDTRTGDVIADTPPARIWDATVDPQSAESTHGIVVPTRLTADGDGWLVTATVPATYFDTPGLTYPVTVDPGATLVANKDTYVEKGYDNTAFGTEDDLKVGTYDGGVHVARSYLQFILGNASGLVDADTVVDTAKLRLWEWHAASCTASTMNIGYVTSSFTEASTWTTKPTQSSAKYQVSDAHRNDSSGSCAEGWFDTTTGTNVQSIVQDWADRDVTNAGFAFWAPSETNSNSWKRFYSMDYATSARRPSLSVTWHTWQKPAAPTSVRFDWPNIPNGVTTPVLGADVTSTESSSVSARFEVWQGATKVYPTSGTAIGTSVAPGGRSTFQMPSGVLVEGQTYTLRAYAYDGRYLSTTYAASAPSRMQFTLSTNLYKYTGPGTPDLSTRTDPTAPLPASFVPITSTSAAALPTESDVDAAASVTQQLYGVLAGSLIDPPVYPEDDPVDTIDTTNGEVDTFPYEPGALNPDESLLAPDDTTTKDTFAMAPSSPLIADAVIDMPADRSTQWDQAGAVSISRSYLTTDALLETSSATSSDIDICINNSKKSESPTGWWRNRYWHCKIDKYTEEVSWEGSPHLCPFNCRFTIGTFRQITVTRLTTGNRRISMLTRIQSLSTGNDPALLYPIRINVDFKCTSRCTNNSPGRPDVTWQALMGRDYSWVGDFDQPAAYSTQQYSKSQVGYRNTVKVDTMGILGGNGAIRYYDSPLLLARCDSATTLIGSVGCVFPSVQAVLTWSTKSPGIQESAQHIRKALTTPWNTLPWYRTKTIPDTLTRYYPRPPGTDDKNRARVRKICQQHWGDNYATSAGYKRDCDEYPFNSTKQRAWDYPYNFSARPIRSTDNQLSGRLLNAFYRNERVLPGEDFKVRIIDY